MESRKFIRLSLVTALACVLYTSASHAANTPTDVRGTEIRQSVIKWEWATTPGADRYEVMMGGVDYGSTRENMILIHIQPGEYQFKVRAYDESEGTHSAWTDLIKIRTSAVFQVGTHARSTPVVASGNDVRPPPPPLPAQPQAAQPQADVVPQVSNVVPKVDGISHAEISDDSVVWNWKAVPGAVKYEVTVDGVVFDQEHTTNTQWTASGLWKGDHNFTVVAFDANGAQSEQSDNYRVEFSGNFSDWGQNVVDEAASPVERNPVRSEALIQPPAPIVQSVGDPNAHKVQSLIDPASYNYSEVTNKPGYELVFSDEFNGTAVNPFRWNTQHRFDGEWNGERFEYRLINGEDQFYISTYSEDEEHLQKAAPLHDPFKFNGSTLGIQAIINPVKDRPKSPKAWGNLEEMLHQQQFLSGVLSSYGKFYRKYGWFEARMKIPNHTGTLPAFWLNHQQRQWEGSWRNEIDIMENLGHAPQYFYTTFHTYTDVHLGRGGKGHMLVPGPASPIYTGVDYSQDFHTYAVKWEPNKITWYVDGVQVSSLADGRVNHEELYLSVAMAVGGNWTNYNIGGGGIMWDERMQRGRPLDQRYPTANDLLEFKNPMLEVDYIRAYAPK